MNQSTDERIAVLFSAGLDSAVLLAHVSRVAACHDPANLCQHRAGVGT